MIILLIYKFRVYKTQIVVYTFTKSFINMCLLLNDNKLVYLGVKS